MKENVYQKRQKKLSSDLFLIFNIINKSMIIIFLLKVKSSNNNTNDAPSYKVVPFLVDNCSGRTQINDPEVIKILNHDGVRRYDPKDLFLEFQNRFVTGDARADFDASGALDLFDFLAFQDAFTTGCP